VVLEALACGTPTIATPEAGGIAEIAANVPGALTIASSGEAFVAAMMACEARTEAALRPSLLTDIYRLAPATKLFSTAIMF
jgi:hypothetical protein